MANIRARKSRRNKVVNTTVNKKRGNQNNHFRKVVVTNPTVAKVWDKKKSIWHNYEKLGLVADPNKGAAKKPKPLSQSAEPPQPVDIDAPVVVETREPTPLVKELEEVAKQEYKKPQYIPEGEAELVRKLIKKHGTDYKAMSRDIKLNTYQHTAKQLKKKCENFLAALAEVSGDEQMSD
eukprot:comp19772_c0_seq1/m.23678 comp19772_c0_seq1/g.23678  ORF comp19772_c0_seq1/g.23678 comp19772_c0_seq1/m.23678 type:complete len:179 (-) comp19772_c0_seq1:383-919(-)